MLEQKKTPSKQFLTHFENIFKEFTNKRVRKAGIKTILKEVQLMVQFGNGYHDESRQGLLEHCQLTLKKYEPAIKIVRLSLKKTVLQAISDGKAPEEAVIEKFKTDFKTIESELIEGKNELQKRVFLKMKKAFAFLASLSSTQNITEEERDTSKKLQREMYEGWKLDCWNLEGVAHDEEIFELHSSEDDMNTKTSETMNFTEEDQSTVAKKDEPPVDKVQEILKTNSSLESMNVAEIFDLSKSRHDRMTKLANMLKINSPEVLTKLAESADFVPEGCDVMDGLCFSLRQLFEYWNVEPPVLEKLVADKIEKVVAESRITDMDVT